MPPQVPARKGPNAKFGLLLLLLALLTGLVVGYALGRSSVELNRATAPSGQDGSPETITPSDAPGSGLDTDAEAVLDRERETFAEPVDATDTDAAEVTDGSGPSGAPTEEGESPAETPGVPSPPPM